MTTAQSAQRHPRVALPLHSETSGWLAPRLLRLLPTPQASADAHPAGRQARELRPGVLDQSHYSGQA